MIPVAVVLAMHTNVCTELEYRYKCCTIHRALLNTGGLLSVGHKNLVVQSVNIRMFSFSSCALSFWNTVTLKWTVFLFVHLVLLILHIHKKLQFVVCLSLCKLNIL
jgi:hypothetical protein